MAKKRVKGKKEAKKERRDAEESERIAGKEKQAREHNKILRNILIGIAVVAAGIFLFVVISNSLSRFEYRGVEFERVRFCDAGPPCLVMYRTSLPVKLVDNAAVITSPSEKDTDYNFYLRNDPRKLNVPFNGTLRFGEIMVLNSEEAFTCNGKGAIAAANLVQLYEVLGTKVINDENATCDPFERYVFTVVKPGNVTKIEEFEPSCYNIYINDCEILEGTEKYMIETLVKVNEGIREE